MENETAPILPGIEHVVVVMFENRSFDNMLGGLYPEKTKNGLYEGVSPGMYNKVDPYSPNFGTINVWQAEKGLEAMIMPYPDPGELFDDMNQQLFAPGLPPAKGAGNPTMGGFVFNYKKQMTPPGSPVARAGDIMQYYAPGPNGNIPIMTALAQAYGVSDAWHASGPVQTLVNRIFAHAGQPSTYWQNGSLYNCTDNTTVPGTEDWMPVGIVNVNTVFGLLDATFGSGQTNWKVYYNDFPLSAIIDYVYDHWGPLQPNVCNYSDSNYGFANDVANDTLPPYSFIEPRYTNLAYDDQCQSSAAYMPSSYHPGGACPASDPNAPDTPPPVSVCFGEQFLADIYTQLSNNPEVFKKTLLIVTFDEHGGLYDHVPPGPAIPPNQGVVNFDYSRYGVRVPTLFINPYIKPGSIFRATGRWPYDHTTIISTLTKQFSLIGAPLTARDGNAPTLAGIINSTVPNSFKAADLPSLTCQVPPTDPRGVVRVDPKDPNSIYSMIWKGMKAAKLAGKL